MGRTATGRATAKRQSKARTARPTPRAATSAASKQMSLRTRRIIFAGLAVIIILMMVVAMAPMFGKAPGL